MNPFISSVLKTLIRSGLIFVAGKLGIQWVDQDMSNATAQILDVAIFMGMAGWGAYDKYKSHQKLLTAQASGQITGQKVDAAVKAGEAPSVMTPKTEVPQLQ